MLSMIVKRCPVWFNAEDKKRYKHLKIKTPFHKKVKELFNAWMEQKEANK